MIRHFAQPSERAAGADLRAEPRDRPASSVTVHEIPDAVMAALVRRAARSGRSTHEYLRDQLAEIVAADGVDDS